MGYAALWGMGDSYPPTGLAPSTSGLPNWMRVGLGDAEYYCGEKGANFPADECPEKVRGEQSFLITFPFLLSLPLPFLWVGLL